MNIDLNSLNKPELLKIAQQLQNVEKERKKVSSYGNLLERIKKLENYNYDIYDRLYENEKCISELAQYTRRENIEIDGIPSDIPQNQLEKTVIEILGTIGVVVTFNIAACHRLKKLKHQSTQSVIVRFINRKHALEALKNRKQLINSEKIVEFGNNLYIRENLCPQFRKIYDYALSIKKKGNIFKVWTFNGKVCINCDKDDKPWIVNHIEDLYDEFDNNDTEGWW